MHERATSSSAVQRLQAPQAVQGEAVSLAIIMSFHDPHGAPLESFIKVRDQIRAQLIPELQRRLFPEALV